MHTGIYNSLSPLLYDSFPASHYIYVTNRIPSYTKALFFSNGSVSNICKAWGKWRKKAGKQQAKLDPKRQTMKRSSTTYMYICFKIRGEVRKNCKSWERN